MALTRFQNTDQIQKDIDDLIFNLEELRKIYEQYFLGIVREEPSKLRDKIKFLIQKNHGVPIQNVTLKFRFQQCVSRYNTYTTYWDRILREIEEGKYQRDVFRAKLHDKERTEKKNPQTKEKTASNDDSIKKLYEDYKKQRVNLKQDPNSVSFETFQKQIGKKVTDFQNKSKNKNVSLSVVQEGGQIKIKVLTKKE